MWFLFYQLNENKLLRAGSVLTHLVAYIEGTHKTSDNAAASSPVLTDLGAIIVLIVAIQPVLSWAGI